MCIECAFAGKCVERDSQPNCARYALNAESCQDICAMAFETADALVSAAMLHGRDALHQQRLLRSRQAVRIGELRRYVMPAVCVIDLGTREAGGA